MDYTLPSKKRREKELESLDLSIRNIQEYTLDVSTVRWNQLETDSTEYCGVDTIIIHNEYKKQW